MPMGIDWIDLGLMATARAIKQIPFGNDKQKGKSNSEGNG
jgi:hypothetical protein